MELSDLSKRIISILYGFEQSGATDMMERRATIAEIAHQTGDPEDMVLEAVRHLNRFGYVKSEALAINDEVRLTDRGRSARDNGYKDFDIGIGKAGVS